MSWRNSASDVIVLLDALKIDQTRWLPQQAPDRLRSLTIGGRILLVQAWL